MITNDIKNTLKSYAANMQKSIHFVLQTGVHSKRNELVNFLSDIASVSEKLVFEERDNTELRSPMTFLLEADGEDTGIRFSGIPSGHEFNSLVLAMLQAGGTEIKLDNNLKKIVASSKENLHFEVFVSLSCHNCPEVVQAVNQFALLNENITSEMIDGGLYQDLIKDRDIQGVPSVYLNGELFANGKVTAAELIDKLIQRDVSLSKTNNIETMPLQDVVVIGGGPAGISAAIYSARKGLKVTIVADRIGGQVKDTMGIENLISVPQTTGAELSNSMLVHLQEYDITLKEHLRVSDIQNGKIKSLTLSSGEVIHSKTIIIATGAKWRELGVPGEKENIGNGVAFCPHCDGPFYKGKDIAVIGGGNSGIEAALDLAGIVKSVTVFEFGAELRADQVLIDQAAKRDNINIIKNAATQAILSANGKVNGIEYINRETDELVSQELEGIFVQIGLVPWKERRMVKL